MKNFLAVVLIAQTLALASCTGRKAGAIKIVNWNVQTFFDAHNDGNEYSEFQKSKAWGVEAYRERVKKLCSSLRSLDGDVVVIEEIENSSVLGDIANFLAGDNWNQKKVYKYACFAKDENSSIGCAVLSRLPLADLKIHSLDIRSEKSAAPSMRPLIEIDVIVPKKARLKLFVNHWKSKAGGQGSALWREWQAALLADRIFAAEREAGGDIAILCAGDFNQDISEFRPLDNAFEIADLAETASNTALPSFDRQSVCALYSPWHDYSGNEGSYYFRENWERIDHFFARGRLSLSDFSPEFGEWSNSDDTPKSFRLYSMSGYSDHLPISCVVEL